MEGITGIEPAQKRWQRLRLPLHHIPKSHRRNPWVNCRQGKPAEKATHTSLIAFTAIFDRGLGPILGSRSRNNTV